MDNPLRRDFYIGFRSTPILLTLIFILGLCMTLDYFVEPNDDVKLICSATSYDVGKPALARGGLRFEIERVDDSVLLEMTYVNDEEDILTVSANGTLIEVSEPVLTYEVNLDDADLKVKLLNTGFEVHMQDTLQFVKNSITDGVAGKGKPFYIKVLEMNKAKGFVTIQVSERNALWACEIL